MGSFETHYEEEVEEPRRIAAEQSLEFISKLEKAVLRYLKSRVPTEHVTFESDEGSPEAKLILSFDVTRARLEGGKLHIEDISLRSEEVAF